MQEKILKLLARCSVLENNMALNKLNVGAEDLEKLCESELIVKLSQEVKGVLLTYYSLTEIGEEFIKANYPDFDEIYRGFILNHDLELSEFYLRRTEKERNSWITKDDMIKQYKLQGTLDGAFINENGEFEGIEVLKHSSSPSVVEKIEMFNKEIGIQQMNYMLYY